MNKKEMRHKAMNCNVRKTEPTGPMVGCDDCEVYDYCVAITITQLALKMRP